MAVVRGKCMYAKLTEPSEETKRFKSKYSIDVYPSAEDLAKLKANGIDTKVHKDSGKEFVRCWAAGKNKKTGELNPPIKIVDAKKNKMHEDPGNGSVVNVQYIEYEWDFPPEKGIAPILQAVQVLKLVPKVADEFEETEGYVDDEATSEFNESGKSNSFDDDIPF